MIRPGNSAGMQKSTPNRNPSIPSIPSHELKFFPCRKKKKQNVIRAVTCSRIENIPALGSSLAVFAFQPPSRRHSAGLWFSTPQRPAHFPFVSSEDEGEEGSLSNSLSRPSLVSIFVSRHTFTLPLPNYPNSTYRFVSFHALLSTRKSILASILFYFY